MKSLIFVFIFTIFSACKSLGNQYVIEKSPHLNLEETYYQKYTSGVKGGGSGYSIFIFADATKNIVIEGVFFRKRYSKLKFHGAKKYQAFIKNNQNLEPNVNESETRKKEITAEEKIPFDLNRDEAVISYFENNTKKFMKVILTKKDSNEVPM